MQGPLTKDQKIEFHFHILLFEILEQVLLRASVKINKVVNFNYLLLYNKLLRILEAQNSIVIIWL